MHSNFRVAVGVGLSIYVGPLYLYVTKADPPMFGPDHASKLKSGRSWAPTRELGGK